MEIGSLVRGTTDDGTSQVDGRYKLSIDPSKFASLDHLWDPAKPSNCLSGMRALALFPDDSEYYAGRIGVLAEIDSFEFLFDDGDVLPSVTSVSLKLLPLPELLVDKDAVKVGMAGQCYYEEENEFYEGTVGADNGDGTYRFDFNDGDVAPSIYLHDLDFEGNDGAVAEEDPNVDAVLDDFLNDEDDNPYGEDFDVSDDDIDVGEASPTPSAGKAPSETTPPRTSPAAPSAVASTPLPPKPLAQSNSDLNILLTNTTGVPAPDSSSPSKPETAPVVPSPIPSPRPPEQSYVDSQSHLHPLLIPPNPLASDTGPAERLQALALEYVDLEFSYLNALNTSINHRDDEQGEELPPPPREETFAHPPLANSNKQTLLVNSMTALKMRSKALSTLLYGDGCLETVQEAIDLATCYSHNQLWVQASLHAKASLSTLDKDLSDTLEIPNMLCRNSATALLHLFDSIRSVLSKCKPDSLALKDLVVLIEGPVYMENIVADIKEIESSATGVEQHGFPTTKLIALLRNMDGYRLCVNSLEVSWRGSGSGRTKQRSAMR
jgi:hypothetical protein